MLIFNKQKPGLFLATRVRNCVVLLQKIQLPRSLTGGEGGEPGTLKNIVFSSIMNLSVTADASNNEFRSAGVCVYISMCVSVCVYIYIYICVCVRAQRASRPRAP